MPSIHHLSVEGLTGATISLADYVGKKMIIVNVASECGYTPQYAQLQELYTTFYPHLVVIGFPCNDFGGQEPGEGLAIQSFCERQYGVSFPLAAKVSIRPQPHPIYAWLADAATAQGLDGEVRWNFHKYLLDPQGQLVASYPSSVSPFDERILHWLDS